MKQRLIRASVLSVGTSESTPAQPREVFREALLASANLGCLIADQHISALEGMIGAFPRRLLVRRMSSSSFSMTWASGKQAPSADRSPRRL